MRLHEYVWSRIHLPAIEHFNAELETDSNLLLGFDEAVPNQGIRDSRLSEIECGIRQSHRIDREVLPDLGFS